MACRSKPPCYQKVIIVYLKTTMEETKFSVFSSPEGFWYLVCSPCTDKMTYIITVDITSGNLIYTGIPSIDVFSDHSLAVKSLLDLNFLHKGNGDGLIGVAMTEDSTAIAYVDKSQVTGYIPGGHPVRTIRNVKFIHLPKNDRAPKTSAFKEFQVNDNHYFCDTYDLTNLFPNKSTQPDNGFIWNLAWKKPFEVLGLGHCCINLIQGVCMTSNFTKFDFQITYIARRSVLNPGTRYNARGLNDLNCPGNEVECELIFQRNNQFWSTQWRRGSIPIRWKTVFSTLSSPKHIADPIHFADGTAEYFRSLQGRFGEDIPIRIISLLDSSEKADENSEKDIKTKFQEAIEKISNAGVRNVFLTPFDLNKFLHSNGTTELMNDFLSYLGPVIESDGFNSGTLPLTINEHQKGLMRFNCADSLDRTNVACFHYAIKVTSEWCIMNNIGLSGKTNTNPNLPYLLIDQSITDFLINAFITTGNVVSYLYTNTPAIKTNAITCFSSTFVNSSSSDSAISIKRRLQNVVNDPQRMKIIELWLKPIEPNWITRIDSRHLFIVPQENSSEQFPRTLIGTPIKSFEFPQNLNILTLCLPCPMQLFSIIILLFPGHLDKLPNCITIEGGMTLNSMKKICTLDLPLVKTPIWLRYRLRNAKNWGFSNPYLEYLRFIRLIIETNDPSYIIGNIKVEALSCFSNTKYDILYNQYQTSKEHENEFCEIFNQYLKSPRTCKDAIELEKSRIIMRVTEDHRNNLSILNGLNPWHVDSNSQLISAPSSFCVFCGSPLGINIQTYPLIQNKRFPGLIETTKI
ncbi:SacI domain containing protein [Histomonas meleagridis]|uniref:SacI-like domain containing protein n=1 Tax=Histomonas meleagridis TaxID=135588 RepID=UPI00355AB85B|nr:SacI domain containing protein [Histomonas meleagridis]KAH0802533.1 SacI-like domain containing protein [Histomonas meleagridis]